MAWDISATWNTGDINSRVTNTCAVINNAGTPYIIAPVQHGVKCFDVDGNLEWTYTGLNNGYDVRDLAIGNLNGTGYEDCVVIASGYYNTSTHDKVGILDKDGNILDKLTTADFTGSPATTQAVAVSGTDIYVSTSYGLHKFTKSGSTWSEAWVKDIGSCAQITIDNMGNGTRIYVACLGASVQGIYCYQSDGTKDWDNQTDNQYTRIFSIGKSDSSKTGKQLALAYQGNLRIIDKDGNTSTTLASPPSNVCGGVTFYDCDGDGEDEIYFTDMARDVYCYERTGTNAYSVKYTLSDVLNSSQYAGVAHFDINNDGDDEIFIFSTDGHCYIYDKTLSSQLKDLNIGHGTAGGYYAGYQNQGNGIKFVDTSGDGFEDLVISGGTGYVDVFECSGVPDDEPTGTDANSERGLYIQGKSTSGSTASLYIEGVGISGNSDRGLYISGYSTNNGERGLYITGSHTLSTDYFNVEFGLAEAGGSERSLYLTGSSSGTSERSLYLIGSLDSSSERSLYLGVVNTSDSERVLYLETVGYGSSEVAMYLGGVLGDTSERSLYIQGKDTNSSERSLYLEVINTGSSTRNLYVPVDGGNYSDRFLYVHGKDTSSSERGLYITGSYDQSSERSLYLKVVSSDSSERALYLEVVDYDSGERPLYLIGNIDSGSERNLFVQPSVGQSSERNLLVIGNLTGSSERSLYLSVVNTESSEKSLYLETIDYDSSERTLYLTGSLDSGSERSLYVKGLDTSSSERSLYLTGFMTDSSERSLYLQVVATEDSETTEDSERGLYITGCLSDNSERTLYLSVNQGGSSERGMWLHGSMSGTPEVYFWDGNNWIQIV